MYMSAVVIEVELLVMYKVVVVAVVVVVVVIVYTTGERVYHPKWTERKQVAVRRVVTRSEHRLLWITEILSIIIYCRVTHRSSTNKHTPALVYCSSVVTCCVLLWGKPKSIRWSVHYTSKRKSIRVPPVLYTYPGCQQYTANTLLSEMWKEMSVSRRQKHLQVIRRSTHTVVRSE